MKRYPHSLNPFITSPCVSLSKDCGYLSASNGSSRLLQWQQDVTRSRTTSKTNNGARNRESGNEDVLFRVHEHESFCDIYGEIDINKIIIIQHGSVVGRSFGQSHVLLGCLALPCLVSHRRGEGDWRLKRHKTSRRGFVNLPSSWRRERSIIALNCQHPFPFLPPTHS